MCPEHDGSKSIIARAYATHMRILDLRASFGSQVRYVLIGASVNGTGYLAYLLLTGAGLSPRLAVTVLLPVSLWAAFQLHGRVTFVGIGRDRTTGLRFLAVMLTGYALNLALLTILVDGVGVSHQLGQLVSIGLIAPVMFQMIRRFVFVAD
jgi:putative flippase GtrA